MRLYLLLILVTFSCQKTASQSSEEQETATEEAEQALAKADQAKQAEATAQAEAEATAKAEAEDKVQAEADAVTKAAARTKADAEAYAEVLVENPAPTLPYKDAKKQLTELLKNSKHLRLFSTKDTRLAPDTKMRIYRRTAKLTKGVRRQAVTKAQASALLEVLSRPTSYDYGPPAACHDPHLGLAFYGAAQKPIAVITICIECLNVYSDPGMPAVGASVSRYGKRMEDGYFPNAFAALSELRSWCQENKIAHCDHRSYIEGYDDEAVGEDHEDVEE